MHLGFSEILLRLRRQLMHMVLRSRVCLSADEYSEQLSPFLSFKHPESILLIARLSCSLLLTQCIYLGHFRITLGNILGS